MVVGRAAGAAGLDRAGFVVWREEVWGAEVWRAEAWGAGVWGAGVWALGVADVVARDDGGDDGVAAGVVDDGVARAAADAAEGGALFRSRVRSLPARGGGAA